MQDSEGRTVLHHAAAGGNIASTLEGREACGICRSLYSLRLIQDGFRGWGFCMAEIYPGVHIQVCVKGFGIFIGCRDRQEHVLPDTVSENSETRSALGTP